MFYVQVQLVPVGSGVVIRLLVQQGSGVVRKDVFRVQLAIGLRLLMTGGEASVYIRLVAPGIPVIDTGIPLPGDAQCAWPAHGNSAIGFTCIQSTGITGVAYYRNLLFSIHVMHIEQRGIS